MLMSGNMFQGERCSFCCLLSDFWRVREGNRVDSELGAASLGPSGSSCYTRAFC